MTQVYSTIQAARERFPSIVRPGSPVYFDNPGGTQVPKSVADVMSYYLLHDNANSHGAFATSERTDVVIAEARAAVADLIGAEWSNEIVFGSNMTTLTFAFSRALGRELHEGDEVVVTALDHDANVAPWLQLAEDGGLIVSSVDVHTEDCTLDLDSFRNALSNRTRLVAFTYASNAVGTVNDVRLLTRLAHEAGALVYIDAVHYAPHGLIDVRDIGCDFLVCSPYKFFGPHSGVLYIRADHSNRLRPCKVRPASNEVPYKWETGTLSHEALAGITAAIGYIASLAPNGVYGNRRQRIVAAMAAVRDYEVDLMGRMLDGLNSLPVTLYGITDSTRLSERVPTFALTAQGISPRQLAEEFAKRGFNTWDGNYYALALMQRLGLEGSGGALRVGLAHYNTSDEVDRFLAALEEILASYR